MTHLILADDMPMQLHSLEARARSLRPDWIIHAARDGNEVLALIERYPIDFIISDIRMPKLDGLVMLEKLQALSPRTLVIFISGFALFEYAQRALKLGCVDFLIKPVDEKTFLCALERLEALKDQRMGEVEYTESAVLSQWLHTAGEHMNPANRAVIERRIAERGWIAAVYRPSAVGRYDSGLQMRLQAHFREHYVARTLISPTDQQVLLMHLELKHGAKGSPAPTLLPLAEDEGLLIGLAAYERHEGFAGRLRALDALNECFYQGERFLESAEPLKDTPDTLPTGRELYGLMRLPEEDRGCRFVKLLHDAKRNRHWFLRLLRGAVYAVAELNDEMKQRGGDENLPDALRRFAARMREILSFEEFAKAYLHVVTHVADQIETTAEQADFPIERCLSYIHEHYSEEITTEDMARMLYLTPNYFSTLFRKKTGRRFIEYLTDLRLERAEYSLRETDDFIYEIARRCGYYDERYFSRIFRSKYGSSPTRYRRLYGNTHL